MATNPPTLTDEAKADVIRKGYSHAAKVLREKYKSEFQKLQVAYCKEHGVDYRPPLTKTEKALADINKLLAENEELSAIVTVAKDPLPEVAADDGDNG